MKNLLVTGGAGFIGGNFVHFAIRQGDVRILTLDKLTYAGNLDTQASLMHHPRHRFVQGDIGDGALVRRLLAEHRPDALVNFAAESHVDRSIDGPAAFIDTNVVGTFNLLDCAREYWSGLSGDPRRDFRFLHVSTDEVYGSLGPEGRFTETTPYAPNSPYSASKAASDHLVRAWHHTYGLPVLTTNCSNNYGPYQFPEKLLPLMILKALACEPLPIIGSPSYFRGLSALCKAFIERCAPLREPKMVLAEKPIGVVAVGQFRNGGQELVIEQIQAAMLCFGMVPVGGHAPAFQGATLLSANDSVAQDELGLKTAAQLGKHVGEAAIKLAKSA